MNCPSYVMYCNNDDINNIKLINLRYMDSVLFVIKIRCLSWKPARARVITFQPPWSCRVYKPQAETYDSGVFPEQQLKPDGDQEQSLTLTVALEIKPTCFSFPFYFFFLFLKKKSKHMAIPRKRTMLLRCVNGLFVAPTLKDSIPHPYLIGYGDIAVVLCNGYTTYGVWKAAHKHVSCMQ